MDKRDRVLKIVEAQFGVVIDTGYKQTGDIATRDAKKAYAYILKRSRKYTLKEIGKPIGRCHASSRNLIKGANDLLDFDRDFRSKVEKCKSKTASILPFFKPETKEEELKRKLALKQRKIVYLREKLARRERQILKLKKQWSTDLKSKRTSLQKESL